MQIKKILITTDLSEESKKAYPVALSLAQCCGAEITLLSVIDTSIQFGYSGILDMPVVFVPNAVKEVRTKVLSDLEQHKADNFAGANVQVEVKEAAGPVHHAIAEYIRERPIDIVVMATHGRSGIERALIGSVSEHVVRKSSKPVMLVPCKV